MRRMRRLGFMAGLAMFMAMGCTTEKSSPAASAKSPGNPVAQNSGPAEAKAPPPTQPTAAATRPSGYGKEEYRIVEQPDEIVSKLKNGAVVIAKRVPSPVVAVRAVGGEVVILPLVGDLSTTRMIERIIAGHVEEGAQ